MLCKDPSELWDGWNKVMDYWENNKTLKKWNLTGSDKFFKDLFFDATNKDFELGVDINYKDLNKFDYVLKNQIKQLESPGDMSSKFKKMMWVGYAKAMKNPIAKGFFHTLSDAQQFRHRVTAQNMASYQQITGHLKDAVVLFEGLQDVSRLGEGKIKKSRYDQLREELESYEVKHVQQLVDENITTNPNASDQYHRIMKFLEGEGAVFADFHNAIESGGVKNLQLKYKNDLEYRRTYINSIEQARAKWSEIVSLSNKELGNGIDQLIDVVDLKYGNRSKVAQKLVERYREVQQKLKKSKDKGYAPHYVLDLLKQSLEMRDKLDLNKELSSNEMDNILTDYSQQVADISVQLSDRLKSKSRSGPPTEYFSRSPALYIQQFVKDVSKFNHNTYVDRAYLTGIKKLTDVIFNNPGDKTAEAAESYLKYLNGMYTESIVGKRIEDSQTGKNIHRLLTTAQFLSKIGLNPRSGIRNLSQSFFTWKWFGSNEAKKSLAEIKDNPGYQKLYEDMVKKYGLEYYDMGTITEGAITDVSLEGFGIDYKGGYLTRNDQINVLDRLTKLGVDVSQKKIVSGMMQMAENYNRNHTFKRAFGSRMRQLRKQQRFIDKDITTDGTKLDMAKLAGKYAARVTELLHFQYGKHGKSELLKDKVGSVMFQFQHYSKSAIALETMIYKDAYKAWKAGERPSLVPGQSSYEFQRVYRSMMLAAIANAVSIPLGINLTSYFGNEIIGKIGEFVQFITGDEEEKKNAFYGKGPLVSQSVVMSDMVEVFNLGLGAGLYDVQMDPDGMASLLTGIREYEDMEDGDLARGLGRIAAPQLDRLFTRTIPALAKTDVSGFIRAEFGLYPGTTELGIDVRSARKKAMESETMQGASDIYERAFGTGLVKKGKKMKNKKLKPDEKRAALRSLARF